MKKQVILIAGYNYNKRGYPDNTFSELCTNRMRWLVKRYAETPLEFVLFDVRSGVVIRSVDVIEVNKALKGIQIQAFRPVTIANYTGDVFNRNSEGIMSITDLYGYVLKVGQEKPRSILELSVFSHGWMQGPILLNSDDHQPPNDPARDSDDKDGRALKDFSPPNMDPNSKRLFQIAFDHDGYIWIWGCAQEDAYRQVLHQVLKSSTYRRTAPGKLQNTDSFHFEFTLAEANSFFHKDMIFFPVRNSRGAYQLSFIRTFLQVRQFLQRGLYGSYSGRIARAARVRCYGALLGTYADLEEGTVAVENPLMVVPTGRPFKDNFRKHIDFYKAYFGLVEDYENRGYGTYSNS